VDARFDRAVAARARADWRRELEKWVPELRVLVYWGTQAER
jgi:hypothetical protein